MSKRQYKPHASSDRAFSSNVVPSFGSGPKESFTGFGGASSPLSYLAEQPDLSALSDPNIVVVFKNLSKKDSTTKARGLSELGSHLDNSGKDGIVIEDALLDAWTKVYPRTSIDLSRRVRQLSHTTQGRIGALSGKRLARCMPDVVGPWLSGTHDGDKGVTRAATQALSDVFPTPEKRLALYKAYQPLLLEYCRDLVLRETPNTLSDERSTSSEDAAALYSRVVASSVAVVAETVHHLDDSERLKQQDLYEEIMNSDKLWRLSSSKDVQARKSIFSLLNTLLEREPALLTPHLKLICSTVFSKETSRRQPGSSTAYIESLTLLTITFPEIWPDVLDARLDLWDRLCAIAKHGSQSGPPQYWAHLERLIRAIPLHALPRNLQSAYDLLSAIREGINGKDELQTNLDAAWTSYFGISSVIQANLSNEEGKQLVLNDLLPSIRQYVRPSVKSSSWQLPQLKAVHILKKCFENDHVAHVLESEWPIMTEQLLEDVKGSAPEQAKEHESSQTSIQQQANRLFSLQSALSKESPSISLVETFGNCGERGVKEAVTVLISRNGKPYGAAWVVQAILRYADSNFTARKGVQETIEPFLLSEMPHIIMSASQIPLIEILYESCPDDIFSQAWDSAVSAMLQSADDGAQRSAVIALLTASRAHLRRDTILNDTNLQQYMTHQAQLALTETLAVEFSAQAAICRCLSSTSIVAILDFYSLKLNEGSDEKVALERLDFFLDIDESVSRDFLTSDHQSRVLEQLLRLQEVADPDIATRASQLNVKIQGAILKGDRTAISTSSMVEVLHRNLFEVGQDSLAVETLVELASNILEKSAGDPNTLRQLLPELARWDDAVHALSQARLPSSLAISDELAGTLYLLEAGPNSSVSSQTVVYDAEGEGSVMRLLRYTLGLLKRHPRFEDLDADVQVKICRLTTLTLQMVNDKIGLAEANPLCTLSHSEAGQELAELLSEARKTTVSWLQGGSTSLTEEGLSLNPMTRELRQTLLAASSSMGTKAFHEARAYADVTSTVLDINGWSKAAASDLDKSFKSLRQDYRYLQLAAFLVGFHQVLSELPSVIKYANELVAELTGLDAVAKPTIALEKLVMLNIIVKARGEIVEAMAKQRLVFFVKNVTSWLSSKDLSAALRAEIYTTLTSVLQHITDIYGEHWELVLTSIEATWAEDWQRAISQPSSAALPMLYSSLRLVQFFKRNLRSEKSEDNEAMTEAWSGSISKLSSGLVNVLKQCGSQSDDANQPLRTVNDLLARQIGRMPPALVGDLAELYPLLQAKSMAVQQIAFQILHKQIPRMQEQVSFDTALEKSTAQLPEELLSLVLQPPDLDSIIESGFDHEMPAMLLGYLASWLLVFDHFKNASYKVQKDYGTHVKEGDYVDGLLQLMFDFLGHSKGKPVDATNFDPTAYSFDIERDPLKDTQWLMIHLYYLVLLRIPSPAKLWWFNSRTRQLRMTVESWTEKNISPHIISSALANVSEWANSQTPDISEDLVIKTNTRTSEVVVTRLIDDQTLEISVRLPKSFPLGQATVEGINRVAVDQKRWHSWLLNAQGAIVFSDSSIIDGLMSFRRNLAGRLKGQTECAICYSIISQDHQLPTKKCATCANLFHGSCLFRWFKTSNSSSCPLCRTAFNYA
ncbi:MAG: hypothetical protein M1828_006874 [Chrysothrix sp. TS-e1954]|nr:MAG: hypothetical protein M1828_006874 [Chrysothrix sp. TS-e1954]